MDISIILVSYNTAHLLDDCLGALKQACVGLSTEIIVVDNASTDDSVTRIRRDFPDCVLLTNEGNVGFGRANNQALAVASGRTLLLLNTDAFVAPDTLRKTLAYMDSHPRCGVLGVRLQGRDGALQPCCRYFPTPFNTFLVRSGLDRWLKPVQMVDEMDWPHDQIRACDWVVGCYYLVRREVVTQVGLFDARYFLYFEEVDHCFAAKRAGWEVTFFPHTPVIHLGGESAKSAGALTEGGRQLQALQVESELLFYRKNYGFASCMLHALLSSLGDLMNCLKARVKRGACAPEQPAFAYSRQVWPAVWRTRLGAKPTR